MDAKTTLAQIRDSVTADNEREKIWEALAALAHKIDVTPDEMYEEKAQFDRRARY